VPFSCIRAHFRFAEAVLKALKGEKGIVQASFIHLPGIPGGSALQNSLDGLDYFSINIELGVCIKTTVLIIG
jgi:malate dehydrogenase